VCKAKVDLGFLLDVSSSIEYYGRGNFQRCIDFIVKLASAFTIGQAESHIGMVKYSTGVNLEFDFNKFSDKQSVIDQIKATTYTGGNTHTGKALTFCKTALFDATARKQVPRILIVMTDGEAQDSVVAPSRALRDSGVVIFSLGIGKNFKMPELLQMASAPKPDHVITADFKQLDSVVQRIKNMACKGRLYKTQ